MTPDICSNRHLGNTESVLANANVEPTKAQVRRLIWLYLKSHGPATSKEIANWLGKPLNAISGRLSELKADSQIGVTGERRDGCAVLRAHGYDKF